MLVFSVFREKENVELDFFSPTSTRAAYRTDPVGHDDLSSIKPDNKDILKNAQQCFPLFCLIENNYFGEKKLLMLTCNEVILNELIFNYFLSFSF